MLVSAYGKIEMWEERYQKEKEQFDWLQRYMPPQGTTPMRDIIVNLAGNTAKVLIPGCGISRMAEEMFDDGYTNIISIDYSYSAIKFQMDTYKVEYPSLVFKQMDARNMHEFKDKQFDIIIEKSLLDAVICSDGKQANVKLVLDEMYRVLSDTGTYVCISHGVENQRMKYLKSKGKYNWKIVKHYLQKPNIGQNAKEFKIKHDDKEDKKNFHFMYVCKKQIAPVDDSDEEKEEKVAELEDTNQKKKANAQKDKDDTPATPSRGVARQASLGSANRSKRDGSVKSHNSAGKHTPKSISRTHDISKNGQDAK